MKWEFPVGFKLVRGAYMTSERRIASMLGVKSPIHDTIQDTHACYDDCAAFMLEEIARGSGSVVLATHNLESGYTLSSKEAEENKGLLSASSLDRQLMRKEILRRLRS